MMNTKTREILVKHTIVAVILRGSGIQPGPLRHLCPLNVLIYPHAPDCLYVCMWKIIFVANKLEILPPGRQLLLLFIMTIVHNSTDEHNDKRKLNQINVRD